MKPWRAMSLAAAIAAIAFAVGEPLDRLSDASFTWHMVQHLLLLFAVPPLLLASRPFDLFARIAGKRLTVRTVRALRPLHSVGSPPVALGFFVAVLWLTHVTPLYEIALERPIVHAFEHGLYLLAGIAFWLPLMAVPPLRPVPYPARLFYAFVALPQAALLGFVLGAAREPWYAHYVRVTSFAHALADQRGGAAVMWIAGGLSVLLALLATLAAWLRRETRAPGVFAAFAATFAVAYGIRAAAHEPGRALYQISCASCHGERGRGSNVAPPLVGASASDVHLMLDTGRMPAVVPYADEIHRRPRFTFAQTNALVAYVLTFSPHPHAELPVVAPANPGRGRLLYVENCAACHGPTGDGSSVGSNDVAPSLRDVSAAQVGEAIRAGPSVMPRFGPRLLSDRDVDAIASYVGEMKARAGIAGDDRGGISLGHAGPVAEGFVAWVFGLGILVLCTRAIAKR